MPLCIKSTRQTATGRPVGDDGAAHAAPAHPGGASGLVVALALIPRRSPFSIIAGVDPASAVLLVSSWPCRSPFSAAVPR